MHICQDIVGAEGRGELIFSYDGAQSSKRDRQVKGNTLRVKGASAREQWEQRWANLWT